MPGYYRRKKTFRKRYVKRRTSVKTKRMQYAKGRVPMRKSLRRFSRNLNALAEKKTTDGNSTTVSSITTSGLAITIPAISQGTGRGARIGNSIFLRYLRLRAFVSENTTGNYLLRFAIVWPRRIDVAIGDFPTSNYNQQFDVDKFTVIEDRLIPLANIHDQVTTTSVWNSGGLSFIPINRTIKVFKRLQYNDNASSTPQETTPIIFLWSADVIAPSPYIDYTLVATFTDV